MRKFTFAFFLFHPQCAIFDFFSWIFKFNIYSTPHKIYLCIFLLYLSLSSFFDLIGFTTSYIARKKDMVGFIPTATFFSFSLFMITHCFCIERTKNYHSWPWKVFLLFPFFAIIFVFVFLLEKEEEENFTVQLYGFIQLSKCFTLRYLPSTMP